MANPAGKRILLAVGLVAIAGITYLSVGDRVGPNEGAEGTIGNAARQHQSEKTRYYGEVNQEQKIQDLARISAELAATRSRLKKTAILAACLADLAPDEIHAATSYLTGGLPQGRIGIGPAAIRAGGGSRRTDPARQPSASVASNRPTSPGSIRPSTIISSNCRRRSSSSAAREVVRNTRSAFRLRQDQERCIRSNGHEWSARQRRNDPLLGGRAQVDRRRCRISY